MLLLLPLAPLVLGAILLLATPYPSDEAGPPGADARGAAHANAGGATALPLPTRFVGVYLTPIPTQDNGMPPATLLPPSAAPAATDLPEAPASDMPPAEAPSATSAVPSAPSATSAAPPIPAGPAQRAAGQPVTQHYVVKDGDTLGQISGRLHVSVDDLMRLNGLSNADVLQPGQTLSAPIPDDLVGPAAQLIPDSMLVYGPASIGFDVNTFAQSMPGYLKQHSEVVEERVTMSGPQIVQLIAQRYSVDPRLLLAAIEYRGRWLSNATPDENALNYPAGKVDEEYKGLFNQLGWVANRLNQGYYGWKGRGLTAVSFGDDSQAYLAAGLNSGTAGLQYWLALASDWVSWNAALSPDSNGFMHTYTRLFGDPYSRVVEIIPQGLAQPEFHLPWAGGESWYLTGGPHGGWGSGSAWAAIDFVADPKPIGCGTSPYWARAIAPGLVVRSDHGEVVVDLDGDGNEQTGWVILYMHMNSDGRVAAGTYVQTGDLIGHPSCEGGFSTGAHLHIARRYNGEWIPAAGALPFVLEGWTPAGGDEYDGYLTRNGVTVPACACRQGNLITSVIP